MLMRKMLLGAAAVGAVTAASATAQMTTGEGVQFHPASNTVSQVPLPPVTLAPVPASADPKPAVPPPNPTIAPPALPPTSTLFRPPVVAPSDPPAMAPSSPPAVGTMYPTGPAAAVPTPAVPAATNPAPLTGVPTTSVVRTPVAGTSPGGQAALAVKQALPETVIPGQPVSAEVTVTNTGTKSADNVVLAGWWTNGYELSETSVMAQAVNGRRAWGLGSLAVGETRTLKLTLTPQPGVTIAEFRSGFDATFSSASDTRAVKVLKPELKLKLVCPEVSFVGSPVTVQLMVTNPTAMPLTNVNVRTHLPDTVTHPKGNGLESELAVLQPGATEILPLDLTAVRAGDGRVRVRVSSAVCEPVEQEVQLATMEARMAVTMNGPKALYQNWPATYEAVIENQGDQPIRAATFEVKLPSGFTDLRASDKPGYDAASHRIVWKIDAMQPGEKRTVIWFGFGKQTEDLVTTGLVTVSGAALKRAEWVTKNLGPESK